MLVDICDLSKDQITFHDQRVHKTRKLKLTFSCNCKHDRLYRDNLIWLLIPYFVLMQLFKSTMLYELKYSQVFIGLMSVKMFTQNV